VGLRHKYLITQLKELVGATPKALARLYRLHYALSCLDPVPDPAHPVRWVRVAQRAGYYDAAHLTREFVALTGHTPTACLQLLRRFHTEHPGYAHALAPRFLPTGSSGPDQQ
jgi:AraC-like DNA-binding protein